MLLDTSRVHIKNNIVFNEQDILIDDNVFQNNIEISINAIYKNTGLGIVLIEENISLENSVAYLFKVGHNDYSIIKRNGAKNEIIDNGYIDNVNPYMENINIVLKKVGNKIKFYVNDELVTIKNITLEHFKIGYYSNANNEIKNINIASEVPAGWNVNMRNTEGGYIYFSNDKFTFKECYDWAEIEQERIFLKKDKKYFLKYDCEGEVLAYAFLSNDDRWDNDDEKNIIRNNTIVLKEDGYINLKFKGKDCTVRNILLSDIEDNMYISTTYNKEEINRSVITINTVNIKKIKISAKIFSISREENSIISSLKKNYSFDDLKLEFNKDYDFEINMADSINSSILYVNGIEKDKLKVGDTIKIFNNVDAIITDLTLYKFDNSTINIFSEKIKKQFVPASITSPIVVMKSNNEVLNMSASYREIDNKFIFTNIEREIFKPQNVIKLNDKVSDDPGAIVIFAILKDSTIDITKLYKGNKNGINEINEYASNYEILKEKDLYKVDKDNGTIIIREDSKYISKYKEIIVDYKKRDSYSVNHNFLTEMYEVDISCNSDTKILYDGINTNNGNFGSINNYKIISDDIKSNSYIVMKGV